MDCIKISIIIPVYNVEKYIAECITSIMAQTLQVGMECVLVDDCSSDCSIPIAESLIRDYEGKISFRIIKHLNNQGLSCARNTGISVSKGEYIGFVDSDDYIEPLMYKELFQLLEDNPDSPFVACPIFVEKEGRTSFYDGYDLYQNNSKISIDNYFSLFLKHEIDNFSWNKLFRRSFVTTLFKEGRIEEDYLFLYQNCKPLLNQNKSVVLSSNPLYHYRIRKGSICRQPKTSVKPLFIDQLTNYREIMSDLKAIGHDELYNCLDRQFVDLLCFNFYHVLLNRRLEEYRPIEVERYWDDIKRISFSKIPPHESAIKKDLMFIKFVPFGLQILSRTRIVLCHILKILKNSL